MDAALRAAILFCTIARLAAVRASGQANRSKGFFHLVTAPHIQAGTELPQVAVIPGVALGYGNAVGANSRPSGPVGFLNNDAQPQRKERISAAEDGPMRLQFPLPSVAATQKVRLLAIAGLIQQRFGIEFPICMVLVPMIGVLVVCYFFSHASEQDVAAHEDEEAEIRIRGKLVMPPSADTAAVHAKQSLAWSAAAESHLMHASTKYPPGSGDCAAGNASMFTGVTSASPSAPLRSTEGAAPQSERAQWLAERVLHVDDSRLLPAASLSSSSLRPSLGTWDGLPWEVAARCSIPPLCPKHNPSPGQQTYKVPLSAVMRLFEHQAIEILGAFGYPVAYARLAYGPEGSRLEVTSDPSWKDPDAIVGPLDYPANLSPDALVHGPRRELYGPFERVGMGFAVGHYSRRENIFTLTPKKTGDGSIMQLSSFAGKQIASVQLIRSPSVLQISVAPEVDLFLIVSSVLAACVASQVVIDELYTTV